MKYLTILAIVAFQVAACDGNAGNSVPAIYLLAQMKPGENRALSRSMGVEVTEVRDSRCPALATCLTGGPAEVDLVVRTDGEALQILTIVLGAEPQMGDATIGRYQFQLETLLPWPRAGAGPTPANQYRADIIVRRS